MYHISRQGITESLLNVENNESRRATDMVVEDGCSEEGAEWAMGAKEPWSLQMTVTGSLESGSGSIMSC